MMAHLITDCCGANVLYEKEADGSLSMWEFCRDCLEPFNTVSGGAWCEHCLDGVGEYVPMTDVKTGTCADCSAVVHAHLKECERGERGASK